MPLADTHGVDTNYVEISDAGSQLRSPSHTERSGRHLALTGDWRQVTRHTHTLLSGGCMCVCVCVFVSVCV